MSKVYLVTGANSGLGLDAVRQLALKNDTKLVYMACRTETKAQNAIDTLVARHQVSRHKLAFVPFNGSASKDTIAKATNESVQEALDGVVFNAGGYGHASSSDGSKPVEPNQVIEIVQMNLLGHVHYLDALEAAQKLNRGCRVIFAGTEISRGAKIFGAKPPVMPDTPEGYKEYMDGTAYTRNGASGAGFDVQVAYGITKGLATLYFSAWAREHSDLFVLTVSPGGTKNTSIAGQGAISTVERYVFPIIQKILGWFGYFHDLDVGAKRYVDAVTNDGEFKDAFPSGSFVATANGGFSGPVGDQTVLFEGGKQYASKDKQDAMYAAMKKYR